MKKEVEKLSHAVQKSTEDKSKAEMDLCQSQIGALSEAKDLCELQIFMIFICAVSPQWAKKWKKNGAKFKDEGYFKLFSYCSWNHLENCILAASCTILQFLAHCSCRNL